MAAKEEELKNNEIKLVARNERFKKAQAKVELLKGELARLHADNRSLKNQLGEAKVAAANEVSEYQSSLEMAALKQTICEEAYGKPQTLSQTPRQLSIRTGTWTYLGDHLAAQIEEWHVEL